MDKSGEREREREKKECEREGGERETSIKISACSSRWLQ